VELRRANDERDRVTTELEGAQELLRQAELVRESQIALTAERDRALAELERLQTVAAEARAEADEQNRLLAEEQDRNHRELESLVVQRRTLEEELGDALERLASAGTAAEEQDKRLRRGAKKLRRLAAELAPAGDDLAEDDDLTDEDSEPNATEAEAAFVNEVTVGDADELIPESGTEPTDYSLFVPGPNGYELVPRTGIPPQAGDTVELDLPEREEPARFEVVRSGRTLPGGDVCVYLAQV
jgi:hypothetical protein